MILTYFKYHLGSYKTVKCGISLEIGPHERLENVKEVLGSVKAYAARNKLVVNEKQILKEVSKASASLKLSLGGSAEAVAIAATKAKQFGINLEQADKMAQSLLNFEESI